MNPLVTCSMCIDPETFENPIFTCKSCSVKIHSLCYGIDITDENSDSWLCSPCKAKVSGIIRCEFCPNTGGAFKQTTDGKWIHVLCALFTDGVRFEDNNSMEPVDVMNITKSKFNKNCAFCLAEGICPLCSKSKCVNRIHITCAQKNNCLTEIVSTKDDTIKFRAYCLQHKPKDSKRRVSSGVVQKMVAKKCNKAKKKYPKSANSNCDWILKASEGDMNVDESIEADLNKENLKPILSVNKSPKKKNKSKKSKKEKKEMKKISGDETVQYSSMWWDSCGGSLDVSLGFVEREHSCYKDAKIVKVTKKQIFILLLLSLKIFILLLLSSVKGKKQ